MSEAPGAGSKIDYTFGQLAIRENVCTFEQVKECLDIQTKLRGLGIEPKKLGDVLIEKGYLSPEQAVQISKLQITSASQQTKLSIPGYEFIAKIGQGAIGSVFKAKQVSMDRVVAVKILSPKYSKDPNFVERFLREARAVAKLHHENVISGIDVGESNGLHYLVMEFVDGAPAAALMKKDGGRLDEKRCLSIGLQVARALNHAHKHGLVHRDVKPENVMVTIDNVAKLCDLGLAKQAKGDSGATMDGTCVGTPNYISPEQARGEDNIDIRADIYSLGASLYHMATGGPPFSGANPMVVMTKHVTEMPESPKKRLPSLSDGFTNLVLRMMSKRREDRPQNPEALIADIEKVQSGQGLSPPTARKSASTIAKPGSPDNPLHARPYAHSGPHLPAATPKGNTGLFVGVGAAAAGILVVIVLMSGGGGESPSRPVRPPLVNDPPPAVNPVNPTPGNSAETVRKEILAFNELVDSQLGNASLTDRFTRPYLRIQERIEFYRGKADFGAEKSWTAELDVYVRKVNTLITDRIWKEIRDKANGEGNAGRFSRAVDELGRLEEVYKWVRTDSKPERTAAGREHEEMLSRFNAKLEENYLTEMSRAERTFRDPKTRDEAYRLLDGIGALGTPAQRGKAEGARDGFFRTDVADAARAAAGPDKLKKAQDRIQALKALHEGNAAATAALDRMGADLKNDLERALSEGASKVGEVTAAHRSKFESAMRDRNLGAARAWFHEVFCAADGAGVQAILLAGWPDAALLKAYLNLDRTTPGECRKVAQMAEQAVQKAAAADPARDLFLDLRTTALLEELMDQAGEGARAASKEAAKFKTGYSAPLKDAQSAEPAPRKAGEGMALNVTAAGKAPLPASLAPRSKDGAVAEDDIVTLARKAPTAAGDPYQPLKALLLQYYAGRFAQAKTAMEKLTSPELRLGLERFADKLKGASSEADELAAKKAYEDAFKIYARDEKAGLTRFKDCVDRYSGTDYMRNKLPNRDKSRIDVVQGYLKGEGGSGSGGGGGQPMGGAGLKAVFGTDGARALGGGRYELTYTFKDDREAAMFAAENPGAVNTRRGPEGGLQVGGNGGWYLNVPMRGNVTLEVSFRTDANTLGFVMHGNGGQAGYAVFVDFPFPGQGPVDALFKLPADPAQLDKAIIARATRNLQIAKGAPNTALLVREGSKIRFSMNQGSVEADDATYNAGRVGLGLMQSGLLLERLKVTGEVEKSWLEDKSR